jgi:hypothetical protein
MICERNIRSTAKLIAAIAAVSVVCGATAAPLNHGDISDVPPGSVMYLDVTESSGTDAVPLFDEPGITGNLLDFDPVGFAASGVNGGSELVDGQLNFTIMASQGSAISSMSVNEGGDYSLFGSGTSATQVAAALSVTVEILEVDGVAVPPSSTGGITVNFTDAFTGTSELLTAWSLGGILDFNAVLDENQIQYDFGVTKAEVVIDNQLIAISEDLTTAFIAKKDFKINATTVAVPEPGSLAALTLTGLLLVRRRRAM